ncbi:MAG TPA: hypothetical protein VGN42_13805 [Pirellulales bacterium]|jgi:predicted DNA-binding transcriptional regulator AlpA|nr:hypothetical protein [Pirellulales bacterium]
MPSSPLRIGPQGAAVVRTINAAPTGPERPPLSHAAAEFARELRTSVKAIRRLDQSGRLPRGIKVGHSRRWPRETIVRWIAVGRMRRTEWEKFYA